MSEETTTPTEKKIDYIGDLIEMYRRTIGAHGIMALVVDKAQEQYEALKAERNSWEEYAMHQQYCGICADYVGNCETGMKLRRAADPDAELLDEEQS